MARLPLSLCCILFACAAPVWCEDDVAGMLKSSLLSDYEKDVAPKTTDVSIDIMIRRVEAVDRAKQSLTIDAWFWMEWKDVRLTWDPQYFGNLSQLVIPSSYVWVPDITLYNSVDGFTTFNKEIRLSVFDDGRIIFVPPMKFNSYCGMSGLEETISCTLKFGSWTYSGNKVELASPHGWLFSDYFANDGSGWQVANSSHVRDGAVYECCPDNIFYTVSFKLLLTKVAEESDE